MYSPKQKRVMDIICTEFSRTPHAILYSNQATSVNAGGPGIANLKFERRDAVRGTKPTISNSLARSMVKTM